MDVTPRHSVELHIEELVLHGFAPGDRDRIGGAVERELARLLAEGGLPGASSHPMAIGRLEGGAFQVAEGARPDGIGARVAAAIYRGLSR